MITPLLQPAKKTEEGVVGGSRIPVGTFGKWKIHQRLIVDLKGGYRKKYGNSQWIDFISGRGLFGGENTEGRKNYSGYSSPPILAP